MHNLFIFLSFLLLFLFCNSSAAARGGPVSTGGWRPIRNIKSPRVVDIGKFAVEEHNKNNHTSLNFEKVVKGESQVVAGMNYKLTITAKESGKENNYEAVVWDKPWVKFRQLTSFKGPV